jgi:predicted ATPase
MELLYVWIKKYKNIEEQGFNFSPKWRFHYDPETGKLDVEDGRDRVIDGFFGEHISNVTAIVGENGSGKSNFLEKLKYILIHGVLGHRCFLVFKKDETDEPFILLSDFGLKHLENNKFILRRPTGDSDFSFNDEFKSFTKVSDYIFYSNQIQGSEFHFDDFPENIHSISIRRQFCELHYNSKFDEDIDILQQYNLDTLYCQFDFILAMGKIIDFLPKEFVIELKEITLKETKERNATENAASNSIKKFLLSQGEKYGKSETQKSQEQLISLYLLYRLCLCFEDFKDNTIQDLTSQDTEQRIKSHLINFLINKELWHDEISAEIDLWKLNREITTPPLNYPPTSFNIQLTNESIGSIKYWLDLMSKHKVLNFFSFNWGDYSMSTGEVSFFDFFAKLHRTSKKMEHHNVVLIIDEGEASFHPNWQKAFIQRLIDTDTLPKIFPQKTFQIILTTHSPFILSDLPKENLIFLKKKQPSSSYSMDTCQVVDGLNDMKQTFGANIHTLLSDGFFMDGLMGDFAKGKIDKVIRYLNRELKPDETITEDEAGKIIDMIGEPILKRHLQQQIQYRKNDKRDEQIAELKQRIEKLENEKNPKP